MADRPESETGARTRSNVICLLLVLAESRLLVQVSIGGATIRGALAGG